MTRAAIYVRISDDKEGRELGVKRQEQDARALAKRKGWEVVGEPYSDNDITGSGRKQRPRWAQLIKDVREDRVDAVVAYSSSRMYRNLRDLSELIELADSGKVAIATVASGEINLSTADGRMIARILATVDQAEWERTSERVIRKRKEKDAKGEFQGGYRPFGFEPQDKHLVVNDPEAKMIRKAVSDVLSGVSISSVARGWNATGVTTTGGKRWTKGHVAQVLSAERNMPAILTPTDHRRIAGKLDGRRTGVKPERYLLTGMLVCGRCGGRMQGRGGQYVCAATIKRNGNPEVHMSAVAERVDRVVEDAAAERPEHKRQQVHDPSEKLVKQREAVVVKMEQLGDSDLPDAVIRGRARKLQRELDTLDKQIAQSKPRGEFEELYRRMEEFDERAWLESVVEKVTLVQAGSRRGVWDPERVQITWR